MYTRSITQNSRTLFVIAIDQSGSMAGIVNVGERTISKAEMVAEVANDLISELIERARRNNTIADYYDIAIIGYSDDGVHSLLSSDWLSIVELDKACAQESYVDRQYTLDSGEVRILRQHVRRWITPKACGATPMYEALLYIHELTERWCNRVENRNSFPPCVSNITDGESTDCDYDDIAEISSKIKALSTRDGNTLLFNIHIASNSLSEPILFPSSRQMESWKDSSRAAIALYNAASEIPESFNAAMRQIKGDSEESYERVKAMSFNSTISEIATILNIGSRSIKRG